MKRCPTCNRTFTDRNLSFCIDDGSPLVAVPVEEDPTVRSPQSQSSSESDQGPKAGNSWNTPAYQPPGSHVPGSNGKRRAWPWVIGILAIVLIGIVGLGVAAVILVPRMLRASANRNRPSVIVTTPDNSNSNSNSNLNSNADENTNANENSKGKGSEDTSAPTDSAAVLSALTDLENEWEVANINADKKALEKILADDYVGISDGKPQGKAQYIQEIKRETTIQKWDFEGLNLSLKGDRATLTGIVKFMVNGQEIKFRFVDKFVWRDGRWQATASQLDPIK
jgi:Domain of unknown function (DUF4440)